MKTYWEEFKVGEWIDKINVRDFIQKNYKPYYGNYNFLSSETRRTFDLMKKAKELFSQERNNGGVLSIENKIIAQVSAFKPGYIDEPNEIIVGLQTSEPLKRPMNIFGGKRMAETALKSYGYEFGDDIKNEIKHITTHNDGVFKVYNKQMRNVRKSGLITGLPDTYGRGRIIGDYRRVALYGTQMLKQSKKSDREKESRGTYNESKIKLIEQISDQIRYFDELESMAKSYGYDITKPACNFREAVQWTYFAYLSAIKEQNGAAMSLGRVSTFFDIYAERDLKNNILNERQVQEIIDDFVIKLRMARHLRTPEYNEIFGGDPMWITEALGGMGEDGRTLVSKTTFRMLNTLYTLGSSPEPNLTILWSDKLPDGFKDFCAKVSIDTSSIQYENDDIMRPHFGDDYAIACCVSAMKIGKQMQFFGARCNLPKLLLLALNGGYDTYTNSMIAPTYDIYKKEILDYTTVSGRVDYYMKWLAKLYVNTMNVIHCMHDKYAYEKSQMALHDTEVERLMAFGIAGLSVMADSLSAIKYAKVYPIRNDDGYIVDFKTEGDFPKYGNDDDRVDLIAKDLCNKFISYLKENETYMGAKHTLSILTITSNVMYGNKTGATPDGRSSGQAFAPGANPMHNREENGALSSLNSVAKISYEDCMDGISNTFSIVPEALGSEYYLRRQNLISILNGYFAKKAHHINVNILNQDTLIKAYENPEAYPNLTIRVSGYAVNFNKLSKEQQKEVISRTFHNKIM